MNPCFHYCPSLTTESLLSVESETKSQENLKTHNVILFIYIFNKKYEKSIICYLYFTKSFVAIRPTTA